jgi:uncharacterized protein (TIGR03437 family)
MPRIQLLFPCALLCASAAFGQSISIDQVEINQAIGRQLNDKPVFVAGKDTVIRAFLNQEVTIDETKTSAVVKRDGQTVATVQPKSSNTPVKIVDFLCSSRAACGEWAAGSYTFEVTVNGVTKSTEGTTYAFQPRAKLRILVRPVKANFGGVIKTIPNEKWKTMWQYTAKIYPIAADAIFWDIQPELDATDSKYDLNTQPGRDELWNTLTALLPAHCKANPKGTDCYDLIVGFISNRPVTPSGELQGYASKPTSVVVATDDDAEMTVAHEIAHVYGVGDTYDGGTFRCAVNPAPDSYKGNDWDNPDVKVSCTAGRVPLEGVSATKIPETQHLYDVTGRGALPDMACYMGSGGKPSNFWTSQEAYSQLFTQLAPPAVTTRLAASAAPQRLLEFSGFVDAGGRLKNEPWFSYTDNDVPADTTGTYQIQAVDSTGRTLATQKLDVRFVALTNPPIRLDWAPFSGAIRFPDTTARFEIVKSGAVLGAFPVSANAPTVGSVAGDLAGRIVNGQRTITWTASDPDGDPLTYAVEYNGDVTKSGSEWEPIGENLKQPSFAINFSELPGGPHAKLRVTASDGIRTGSADSSEFVVATKAPEVFVREPDWGYNYAAGDEVRLEAEAFDLQDEWLEDDKIVWTSNISGKLGTGTELIVDTLPAGQHFITATATNSAALTGIAYLTINVGNVANGFVPATQTGNYTLTNTFKNQTSTVTVPVSAATSGLAISFESALAPASATPPAGLSFIDRNFRVSAQKETGSEWTDVTSVPTGVTLTLDYSAASVATGTLKLFRWNTASSTWVEAITECSPASAYDTSAAGKLSVRVCQLGSFSLAAAALPTISNGGVVSAASSGAVAPGSLVSVYGFGFASGVSQASGDVLPTTLGNVQVLINGAPAPLLYVSPGQINAQLPFEATAGPATAQVVSNTARGPVVNFTVAATAPGVFLFNVNRAVAVNNDSGQVNTTDTQVKAGSYLIVYVTGQGALDNAVPTGTKAKLSPLSLPVAKVTATVGGKAVPAADLWAGMTPGYVGLLQVNLKVPADTPAGDQPLVITIGGNASNTAVVTVTK